MKSRVRRRFWRSAAGVVVVAVVSSCSRCGDETDEVTGDEMQVFDACASDEREAIFCDLAVCQLRPECVNVPEAPVAPQLRGLPGFADSVRFLWEADDPVIRGLDPTGLDENELSVLRGAVMNLDGEPLAGVRASVVGRPELGWTYSRADGQIDLVTSGGGAAVVRFESFQAPAVDRRVIPRTGDYSSVPPIVMTPYDEVSSSIDLRIGGLHVASTAEDDDGNRALAFYFSPGTLAQFTGQDGVEYEVEHVDVRATEYTVGDTGLDAMPADLPEATEYTYAAELTVDQARGVGADGVRFTRPVTLFLDNFLGLGAGTVVPSGSYDRSLSSWQAQQNGRVAQLVSGGVDIDGDGKAESAAELDESGFDGRAVHGAASKLYDVGETFWLASVEHFSPVDLNFPGAIVSPPPDGVVPPSTFDSIPDSATDPCETAGSVIECENRVLGKTLPVYGTDLTLSYRSDRVAGRGRSFSIDVFPDGVDDGVRRVTVDVALAGRLFQSDLVAAEGLTFDFEWDGLDAYGREVPGEVVANVTLSFWYDAVYTGPVDGEFAFGEPGSGESVGGARRQIPLRALYDVRLGTMKSTAAFGLGGWQFASQHAWDAQRRVLYPGAAPARRLPAPKRTIENFEDFQDLREQLPWDPYMRGGFPLLANAGGGALVVGFTVPGTQGALAIWRREPNGSWQHLAGGTQPDETPSRACFDATGCSGSDALSATVLGSSIGVLPGGEVVVAYRDCIWQVADGVYEQLAGACLPDGPAIAGEILDIAVVGSQIWAGTRTALYRVDPSTNEATLMAGCAECAEVANPGEPAARRGINGASVIAASTEGAYFTGGDGTIGFVDSNGIYSIVWAQSDGAVQSMAVGPDGALWFMARLGFGGGQFVFRLTGGEAERVVGAESVDPSSDDYDRQVEADGIDARDALLVGATELFVTDSGELLFISVGEASDSDATGIIDGISVIKIVKRNSSDSLAPDAMVLGSRRGGNLHRFDELGRLVETFDSVTGGTVRSFEYGEFGVTAVVDPDRGRTTIERAADGSPTAIVAPGGLRTELTTDSDGNLASVTHADGASYRIESSAGLIGSWTEPGNHTTTYQWDARGGLARVDDPAGGWKTLTEDDGAVTLETSSGRTTSYTSLAIGGGWGGGKRVVDRSGNEWLTETSDGSTTTQHPDGTIVVREVEPDPRLGPLTEVVTRRVTTTPSGLSQEMTRQRAYEYVQAPLEVATLTETTTVNGAVTVEEFDAAQRTRTVTSPEGRQFVQGFDEQGRVVSHDDGVFEPVVFEWFDDGEPASIRQGNRELLWTRDDDGFVTAVDRAGDRTEFGVDELGRTVTAMRGGAMWTTSWDPRGYVSNLASDDLSVDVGWDPRGLLAATEVPGAGDHTYDWSVDRDLESFVLPDGTTGTFETDAGGRPTGMTIPGRTAERTWNDVGQVTRWTTDDTQLAYEWDGFLMSSIRQTVGPADVEVARTFDDDFFVVARDVGPFTLMYDHDDDGLLVEASGMTIVRGEAGEIVETSIGDVVTAYTYDTYGRQVGMSTTFDGAELYAYSVELDDGDRVVASTERVAGAQVRLTYERDALGQLTGVARDGASAETYDWAALGRRTTANGASAAYDADGRLTSQGAFGLAYDANGRVDELTTAADSLALEHDALGNLVAVVDASNARTEFVYDARGYRVGMFSDGVFARGWIYDDDRVPIAQVDSSGDVDAAFTYATRGNVPDLVHTASGDLRLVTDWRGSVRMAVDVATGQVVQERDYDAFGVPTSTVGRDVQPFAFAGGLDHGLPMYAFSSRFYAPEIGRWLAPDRLSTRGGSLDLWLYVAGDPVSFYDRDGDWIHIAIGGAAAAAALAGWGNWFYDDQEAKARDVLADWKSENSGCSGFRNGPTDAIKHCTILCTLQKTYGSTAATSFGYVNEWKHELYGGGPKDEEEMDLHNNACGIEYAETEPETPCLDRCKQGFHEQDLVTLDKSKWTCP